ncbi:hypothetical protein [Leadbetterella byssophila]|uniref:hypothetical protein n=1 Tax=Leadbetterella byssophila TaxID=316068 RepID=UPI0039A09D06
MMNEILSKRLLAKIAGNVPRVCVGRFINEKFKIRTDVKYKNKRPKKRTAKDSFYSLLESENVYTENPYGSNKMQHLASAPEPGDISELSQEWEQSQQRTIDPKRTVVLLRKEEKK